MVILGAGASYDSVDLTLDPIASAVRHEKRPPLAKELFQPRHSFAEVVARYPDMAPLVTPLRRAIGKGDQLEQVLHTFEAEAATYPTRTRQLLAIQCYLRDIIGDCGTQWATAASGVTHYAELADELERWRSINRAGAAIYYVNFNYDVMFDDVLARTYRRQFEHMADYIAYNDLQLFKPHGSVNWGHPVWDTPSPGSAGVTGQHLFRAGGIRKIAYNEFALVTNHNIWTEGAYMIAPALAVPIQGKAAFEFPQPHKQALVKAIANTTAVITIGWRGVEQHFLELWKGRSTGFNLACVSGQEEASRETVVNLQKGGMFNGTSAWPPAFAGGFGDFLASGDLRRFVRGYVT